MRSLFFLLLCVCASCAEQQQSHHNGGVRIVSMSPGITQTLVDLGLEENIVGRSPFCNGIDESVPPVYCGHCQVLAKMFAKELSENGAFSLHHWPLDSIDDIEQVYNKASDIFTDSTRELILNVGQVPVSERVLIITQGSDVSAGLCFGSGTYLDDVINSMGLANALDREGWAMLSLEDVAKLNPDRILVVSDTPIKEESVKGIRSLNIPMLLFEHEHVLIPSSQVSNVARALHEQLVLVQ